MNPSILTHLKTLVERVVRPVLASETLKRKMREELLAHVSAVFEEEAEKGGEERLALERSKQRFGNPAELTPLLQESVPARDHWVCMIEKVFMDTGQSPLRLALRYAMLSLFFPGAFLLGAFFVQGRMAEWPIVIAAVFLTFSGVLLIAGMRDALFAPPGRSWLRAALVGVASWFLVPGITFALCLTFSGDGVSSLISALPVFLMSLLTPGVLIIPARFWADHIRARQEWTGLNIDQEIAAT